MNDAEKFYQKNKELIENLNKFIDENKTNIARIVVGRDLLYHLLLLDDMEIVQKEPQRCRYRNVSILSDDYAPPTYLKFLMKDAPKFKFNIPCVCGIYNDEPHP